MARESGSNPVPLSASLHSALPCGPWSKVVPYIGNREPFGTQAVHLLLSTRERSWQQLFLCSPDTKEEERKNSFLFLYRWLMETSADSRQGNGFLYRWLMGASADSRQGNGFLYRWLMGTSADSRQGNGFLYRWLMGTSADSRQGNGFLYRWLMGASADSRQGKKNKCVCVCMNTCKLRKAGEGNVWQND